MGSSNRRNPADDHLAGDAGTPRNVEELLAEEMAANRSTRRRGWRYLALLLVGLLILVVAAPQVICRTPLLANIVDWGAAKLRGKIKIGQASLNWFTALHADQVEIEDEHGQSVLRADQVTTDRTLLNLAGEPTKLGRWRLEKPTLNLVTRVDNTTNVEHVLKEYLEAEGARTPIDVAIEFVEGTADIFDEVTGKRWQLQKLNGVVIVPAESASPLSIDLSGAVAYADGPRPFALRLGFRNAGAAGSRMQPVGDAKLDIAAVPLDLVAALTRRMLSGLNFSGTATGTIESRFDWSAESPAVSLEGVWTLLQPSIGGALLMGDELRLARVELPFRLSVAGKQLQVDRLGIGCDVATVDVRMVVDDYDRLLSAGNIISLLDVVTHCDGQATGRINLAQVARAVPHVLHLRDDVEITGGDLAATIVSRRTPDGTRQWQADIGAGNLTSTSYGVSTTWTEPLSGMLTAVDTPAGPVIDRIACRSEFLVIDGKNSPNSFELNAEYSLDRLVERLSRFIDFGNVQLRGSGTAQGSWTREPKGRFRAEATALVRDFELLAPGYPAWTEQQLVVGTRAVGRAVDLRIELLEEATLGLESAGDQLTARLTAPVTDLRNPRAVIPLAVEGRGQLGTWFTRLRPFLGLPKELIGEGQLQLSAVGQISMPDEITIVQSKLVSVPFKLAAYGLAVDEPSADLSIVGRYSPVGTEVREAVLNSPGTQALVRNLVYAPGGNKPPELHGEMGVRADLARVLAPILAASTQDGKALQLSGVVEASGKLERTGAVTAVAIDALAKNFQIGRPGTTPWSEPQLRLVGSGIYEPSRDALAFDRLELAGETLRILLNGKLERISEARVVDCRGEITYDLAKITPLAQAYLGKGVVFNGRSTQQFQVAGSLVDPARPAITAWHQLRGTTKLGWDQLNLYGFHIPQGLVDVGLEQGILRTSALEVPVGAGRVRATPALRIGPEPMELRLEPGTIIDHVTITQEMADERLKYVMPIMAGVAQVGGQFSVALEDFRIPLQNIDAGAVTGKMTVHNVDIGPGMLTQELADLLGRGGNISLTRESTVDFKMIEGRIYHQNLEFAFPQMTMRTMGSVGVKDQSLSLMAEVPIPSQILANAPIAQAALAGQVIRVPIAGTLMKPTLDRTAFQQATQQFIQNAAQGALQQALGGSPAATAQDTVTKSQNAATDFLQRGTNAAQNAINRSTDAAQGVLNRGLNRLLGPGAANPTTTENR